MDDILNHMICNLNRALLLLVLVPAGAWADLELSALWSRASVPGSKTAAVYGRLINGGQTPVTISTIETPVAERAGVHRSRMKNGMMSMSPVERMTLEAGDQITLEPAGLHLMLMGLRKPLKEGSSFPIEVTTEDGSRVSGQVKVGSIGQLEPPTE